MRKHAVHVPQVVSRLLQSTLRDSPPTWYLPVLANPPPVLPPRQVSAGSSSLLPKRPNASTPHKMKRLRQHRPRPREIVYEEDRIRRQFFRDFPFEALRPTSLVEMDEIEVENHVRGHKWTQLEQRGRFPSVEDAIAFVICLHRDHQLAMTEAYARAIDEFTRLRAAHEAATIAAHAEATAHGASFGANQFQRTFEISESFLDQLNTDASGSRTPRNLAKWRKPGRWAAEVSTGAMPRTEFTGGKGYIQKWLQSAPPSSTLAPSASSAADPKPSDEPEPNQIEMLKSMMDTADIGARMHK